jgi:5,10-methylenetetrahydromethanopterin reductase
MRFGISWVPTDLHAYAETVRRTEEIGVDVIGVPDSQAAQYRECFVTLTHLFGHTDRVSAGPLVSNPVTRHPAVMAAALASANELSHGRAFVCIGVGDSGVLSLGLRPARLARLADYVHALRDLLTTGHAVFEGRECKVSYVAGPLPIIIAANGPRTLRLAGEIADGVLIGSGLDADTVAVLRAHVAEGAAAAGRTMDQITVSYMVRGALADTREAALDLVRPSLAGAAAHIFRSTLAGKNVPPEMAGPLAELQQRIDPAFKSIPGRDNPNGRLIDELGLTSYLADRLGLIGTETEAVARLTELNQRGVDRIVLRPLVIDRTDFLDRFERVIAAVQSHDTAQVTPAAAGSEAHDSGYW